MNALQFGLKFDLHPENFLTTRKKRLDRYGQLAQTYFTINVFGWKNRQILDAEFPGDRFSVSVKRLAAKDQKKVPGQPGYNNPVTPQYDDFEMRLLDNERNESHHLVTGDLNSYLIGSDLQVNHVRSELIRLSEASQAKI